MPANNARPAGVENLLRASCAAGWIALSPNRASTNGCAGIRSGPRIAGSSCGHALTTPPSSRRYAARSAPSCAAVSSTDFATVAAVPSSSGCASISGGVIQRNPCASSGKVRKNGDAIASGWTAEQMSWTNPGKVSSAERTPPPIVGSASSTSTFRPARAISIAAARPFGPDPITIASGWFIMEIVLEMTDYWYSRVLFERSLALLYLVGFLVAANQFVPLLGEH